MEVFHVGMKQVVSLRISSDKCGGKAIKRDTKVAADQPLRKLLPPDKRR